jgi:iron complex transport system substrate-binding protein
MTRTARYPERIVCLTEETTETLYLLGEQDRIVGISGFTVRPPQARKEKSKVSAFTSAKINRIIALKPDLVLGFSDLQADIAAALIRKGINVLVMNQRSVAEILDMILMLSAMVGASERGAALVRDYEHRIEQVKLATADFKRRPRVYFEEWDEPMISAIRWVSELVNIAGGEDCFVDLGMMPLGKDRIIADSGRVISANPQIIIGSWCGKKFRPEKVCARAGWETIDAIKNGQLFEIKSPNILQPGPAALSDGLDQLHQIMLNFNTN